MAAGLSRDRGLSRRLTGTALTILTIGAGVAGDLLISSTGMQPPSLCWLARWRAACSRRRAARGTFLSRGTGFAAVVALVRGGRLFHTSAGTFRAVGCAQRWPGTFHAAGCAPLQRGTPCAYGNRIPVPDGVECPRLHRNVPDGVDGPRHNRTPRRQLPAHSLAHARFQTHTHPRYPTIRHCMQSSLFRCHITTSRLTSWT